MVSLILLCVLASTALATASIKCYSCIVPQFPGADFSSLCNVSQSCTGYWCTKGPDARSSGTLYGCMDTAPVEVATSTCKAVNSSRGAYSNCYCNNIEYCNGGGKSESLLWLILASITYMLG